MNTVFTYQMTQYGKVVSLSQFIVLAQSQFKERKRKLGGALTMCFKNSHGFAKANI